MANTSGTKCPKCENTSFELVEDAPLGAAYKMYYMRCSSCKTFLHAVPFLHTNALINHLQDDMSKLKRKLGA